MSVTCPRCLRSLSTSDPNGPPLFCMFCGQKLQEKMTLTGEFVVPPASPATPDMTVPHSPETNPWVADGPEETMPATVGGYRLLRPIGAGGMGRVYEAEAPGSGARVAVKLLSPRLTASQSSVERFRQEGRLASQLSHPRCVFVLAADTDAGRPYIVMELMPGRTLKDLVDQSGPVPPNDAIAFILDVIDGLAEAHRMGVLHRDVKPSNCFLTTDGRVKVGDFGLSKSLAGSDEKHLTQSGTFLGTVLFASPEQLRGQALDYGSDVYAVCATLYYLLCGEAPFQHESVTAALAKAISEPPPPLSDRRPEVSRPLEKVVMKGLERDRDRRWTTLADLREALVDLLPSRQTPARPRALVGAYLVDRVILAFLSAPVEILRQLLLGAHDVHLDLFELRWAAIILLMAYFTIGEGVIGATPGKWLLGLRVSRVGQAGPPGLWHAFVRTIVFLIVLMCIIQFPEWLVVELGSAVGGGLGGGLFVVGVVVLLGQLRRTSGGFRGAHDFASGCHVTQRPFPARKLRLVSPHPSLFDRLEPPDPDRPLPEVVGGYAILGRVWSDPTGEQVWAGEDTALGRRALLWLRPDSDSAPATASDVARSTRLRRLGSGKLPWAGRELAWTAYAAPVGVPLVDAIQSDSPLPWADARFLLDQLVDELEGATIDGSTPARLELDQVWVEPAGRVQLCDFPMPTGSAPVPSDTTPGSGPFSLLRQVASLTLEGRPRLAAQLSESPGRTEPAVRAPVPPHAVPILEKLFAADGYRDLADIHRDLLDTHAHPPEVTPAVRAAHLGIQAAFLGLGLLIMFGASGGLAVLLTKLAEVRAGEADQALIALHDPALRREWAGLPAVAAAFDNPAAEARIMHYRDQKWEETNARRKSLLSPHRAILNRAEEAPVSTQENEFDTKAVQHLLMWATKPTPSSPTPWGQEARPVWVVVLAIPLIWVVMAAAFRGGVSMLVTGVAVVRADGRPARRWQCGARAVAVWLPVTGLLIGSMWLQECHFGRPYTYVALWLIALALLPVYVVVALWYPSRPPQDRIARTYLVPM